jgi:uncharacterized membrane protein
MKSIIVATFQNLQDAEKSLGRIRELDRIDDIAVYNILLAKKNDEINFEFLYSDGPDTKRFPAKGAITGLVIGALAGPLGAVVGTMAGGISGSLDKYDMEMGQEIFLNKIMHQLKTGDYALIMDVEEDDPNVINFYLEQNGAVITRTIRDDGNTNR